MKEDRIPSGIRPAMVIKYVELDPGRNEEKGWRQITTTVRRVRK
jgi:hypothetical protein